MTTAVQTGNYVDPTRSRVTVGAMAEQWLAGKVGIKPSTQALYDSILSTHVLPRWESVPITRVQHGDVQTWVASLVASGLSQPRPRRGGVLSGVLRLPSGIVAYRPIPPSGSTSRGATERRRRYLAASQVERLAVRRTEAGSRPGPGVLRAAVVGAGSTAGQLASIPEDDESTVAEAVMEVGGRSLGPPSPTSRGPCRSQGC